MKYKIMIDKNTIRKNPNAGMTQFKIHDGHIDKYELYANGKIVNGFLYEATGIEAIKLMDEQHRSLNPLTDEQKKCLGSLISISEKRDVSQIIHDPEPLYLFDYEPQKVQCEKCKAEFDHTELDFDDNDEWSYEYSDTVCPKCHYFNCCEIEYQDIYEVMR